MNPVNPREVEQRGMLGQGTIQTVDYPRCILHPAFCDYCSTIEGESELSRDKHRTTHTSYPVHHNLYLHTGAMMRDLTVGQYLTRKELCSSNCLWTPHATPLEPTQNAATDYHCLCTVSDCSFTQC